MILTTRKILIIKTVLIVFLFCRCGNDNEIDNPITPVVDDEVTDEVNGEDFQNYTWNQQGETIEDVGIPFFGGAMDMNILGDKLIIGSEDPPSACSNFCDGVVRVYNFKDGKWMQIGDDLYGDLIGDADFIGNDVGINSMGNFIVASYRPFTNGSGKFITRVFNQVNGNWVQVGTDILNSAGLDNSVALNAEGNVLVVEMEKNNRDDLVKIYKLIDNEWRQIGEDIIPGEFYDQISLSSKGDILAIGQSLFSAKVKFYDISINGWTPSGEIKGAADDKPLRNDYHFSSKGNAIIFGGSFESDCGTCVKPPRIQVYSKNGNDWKQKGQEIIWEEEGYKITSQEAVAINQDGTRIAIGLKRIREGSNQKFFVLIFQYSDTKKEWEQIPGIYESGKIGGVWSLDLNDEGDILAVGVDNSGIKSVEVFKLEPLK
jgi:hypothetical protein